MKASDGAWNHGQRLFLLWGGATRKGETSLVSHKNMLYAEATTSVTIEEDLMMRTPSLSPLAYDPLPRKLSRVGCLPSPFRFADSSVVTAKEIKNMIRD